MSSLRLVLVGKTGAGKSSAGNTILGKKEFKACVSFSAVTAECQKGEGEVNGRPVTVVDTPGIADLKVSVEEAKDRVAECFRMSAPGPHVFLLVIKLDRFTAEEKQAADVIRGVFGEAALEHTIVLFTHGDELENPDALDTLLSGCAELTHLLNTVNQRYHAFNNKVDDRTQVTELLKKIDKMVGERGRYYTSEMFQKAEEKRKEEQEKERMRREMEKLRQEWNEMPDLRILLIGTSTSSNRFASKMILEERTQCSDTDGCQKSNGDVLGRRVSVVETPGLSEIIRKPKEIMKEIQSCICLTSPGPHAFVIVERSQEESVERKDILELIKDVFGDQALNYVMLLAIESSANYVHSFDNDSHSAEHSPLLTSKAPLMQEHLPTHTFQHLGNYKQVISLLQKIDRMVKKQGGRFFTNEMYSRAEKAITEAQDKILENRKSEIMKRNCDIRWEGKDGLENSLEWKKEMIKARQQAERKNTLKNGCIIAASTAIGTGAGAAVGAALGAVTGVAMGGPAGAVLGAKVGASIASAVGAGTGGVVGTVYRYELRKACNMQ